ncbi:BACON domain-containing protein, partial [bacterium]|nr:BACON domain-containing protein [bacterium]
KVTEVCLNGEKKACSLYCPDAGDMTKLRLSTQYSSLSSQGAAYFDDLLVEAVLRSDSPVLVAPDELLIGVGKESLDFEIGNGGPEGEIPFSITSDADWLTVSPASGTVTTSQTITATPDTTKEKGYYKAKLTVNGGSYGTKVVNVIWQNEVFYYESFETLQLGDIYAQDPAWSSIYTSAQPEHMATAKVVSGGKDSSKALNINLPQENGGTHTVIRGVKGTYARYNLKMSFDIKFGDKQYVNFGNNDNAGGEFSFSVNHNGFLQLRSVDANYTFPYTVEYENRFTHASITMNTTPGNYRLLGMTFNDYEVNDLDLPLPSRDDGDFPRFRLFYWYSEGGVIIDNLKIEAVPIASASDLDVTRGRIAYIGTNTVTMTVYNNGTSDMPFETVVEEGADWLSIEGADEDEVYSDTIHGTASYDLKLNIDRSALGLQFGRGKLRTTNGVDTKYTIVTVATMTGGGAVFYENDFENNELGIITDVEPGWLNPTAEVVDYDSNRCLVNKGLKDTLRLNVPEGLSSRYNFRFSARLKLPVVGGNYSPFQIGTDKTNQMGAYYFQSDGSVIMLSSENMALPFGEDYSVPVGEWFPFSFTYNADPLNRRLLSITFGDVTYDDLDIPITSAAPKDYFNDLLISTVTYLDYYYIDDIVYEAVSKGDEPPVMSVVAAESPVSYSADTVAIVVNNKGAGNFNFRSEVVEGGEYLKAATNGTVWSSFRFVAKIDRSKLDLGFYRPVIRFTSDIEGAEPIELTLAIQSGSPEKGYVMYASDFNRLNKTTESGSVVKGELSEQDQCWVKYTDHNRCDIVDDPAGSEKKVMKIVNANDWSADCGYGLNLNIPAETCLDFDVVCSADVYIPSTFVDRPGEQHPDAYFLLSQDDAHRMNDVTFYLDETRAGKPVSIKLNDIENTSWWEEHAAASVPVENGTWFAFSERFNCELIDYEYKTLVSVVFGENEYEMEGADSRINYPDGIDDEVLNNEYLKAFKLFCGCDDAGICLDNFQIRLVPKGVPEPALLGLALLLALAFARKQS